MPLPVGPVSKVAPIDKPGVAFAIAPGLPAPGEHLTWQITVSD